jgi:hypothetical protein
MKHWFILLLALAPIGFAQDKATPAPVAVANEKLPTAREVIDRYVQLAGGKEAFLKINSVLLKARTEVGGKELGGNMMLATAKPNKLLLTVDLGGIAIRSGFDGTNGWQMNPLTGPSIMEGAELRDMERQADFFAILHEDKNYKSMTNLGKVDFQGEPCYKIKLIDTGDTEVTEFYSIATGLQKGFTGSQESSFGKITATSVNHEHKKFGDLLLPSKVTQTMAGAGLSQTMVVESVEFNNVPNSLFALPPEIKALLQSEPKKEEEKREPAPAAEKPAKT